MCLVFIRRLIYSYISIPDRISNAYAVVMQHTFTVYAHHIRMCMQSILSADICMCRVNPPYSRKRMYLLWLLLRSGVRNYFYTIYRKVPPDATYTNIYMTGILQGFVSGSEECCQRQRQCLVMNNCCWWSEQPWPCSSVRFCYICVYACVCVCIWQCLSSFQLNLRIWLEMWVRARETRQSLRLCWSALDTICWWCACSVDMMSPTMGECE